MPLFACLLCSLFGWHRLLNWIKVTERERARESQREKERTILVYWFMNSCVCVVRGNSSNQKHPERSTIGARAEKNSRC